jgi:hypothetical protein
MLAPPCDPSARSTDIVSRSVQLGSGPCTLARWHLGNHAFERWPQRAFLHYEVGMRIAELSLPPGFDGLLSWGLIYSRPYLRCLHGHGLCLWRIWRLRRFAEAQRVFERSLSLNTNDNQGVRFCWHDVRQGARGKTDRKKRSGRTSSCCRTWPPDASPDRSE